MNKLRGSAALAVIAVVVLLFLAGAYAYTHIPKAVEDPVPEAPISLPDFQHSETYGFYGTLQLEGYPTLVENFDEESPDGKVEYIYFNIVSTKNTAIYDFLSENKGNLFVTDKSVGLGCYDKNTSRLYAVNNSDSGAAESALSGRDLQALLSSNANKPVTLQITRPIFTGGGDAPSCYSHFRDIKVLSK